MSALIWMVIVGPATASIARLIFPGKHEMGFLMPMFLGVVGSLLGGFAGSSIDLYPMGEGIGLLGSALFAALLLFIYGEMVKH